MPADRFYIGPYDEDSGLRNDVKPFMIPDKAFAELNNAYCWRDRIRKRFGSRWLGQTQETTRLRVNVGTTNGAGNLSGTVPGIQFKVGQAFSIGTEFYTVVNGTPGSQFMLDTGDPQTPTADFNVSNGNFIFIGASANTPVYWYPALPVTGMASVQNAVIDNEPLIAFDTQFAYSYNNGWNRISNGASVWTGAPWQYFWATTYIGVNASDYFLFVTNFNQNDPNYMRFYDGTTWYQWFPAIFLTGGLYTYMTCALAIVPFHNRLLAFNVWETQDVINTPANLPGTQYANRLRYSGPTSPIDQPLPPAAIPTFTPWLTFPGSFAGAIDSPAQEAIVTVQFIKDRLIVGMESSTWEIVYTGNQTQPFAWQQINTELGTESTFSTVPFDKVVLSIGNTGIIGCTGANVQRIDNNIPDEVFKIQNVNNGIQRVYGIRDFYSELTYWTFPDESFSTTFPYLKRVMVYNYKNGTWSFNDDSFTVFGYFQPVQGITWADTTVLWSDSQQWGGGSVDALFRQVAAGNQQGWTFIIDTEETTNALSIQITNISNIVSTPEGTNFTITAIDYNMHEGDYIYLEGITDFFGNLSNLNDTIAQIVFINPDDPNNFIVETPLVVSGIYEGGGLIARVSKIQLLTKQYNFYLQKGRNFYVSRVDFLVDRTSGGQIEVDYYVSTNDVSMVSESSVETLGTGAIVGTSVLETTPYTLVPFEQAASQLWHSIYFQADGEFVQLNMQLNDAQMRSIAVMESDFQLHSMIFWTQVTSQWLR